MINCIYYNAKYRHKYIKFKTMLGIYLYKVLHRNVYALMVYTIKFLFFFFFWLK